MENLEEKQFKLSVYKTIRNLIFSFLVYIIGFAMFI